MSDTLTGVALFGGAALMMASLAEEPPKKRKGLQKGLQKGLLQKKELKGKGVQRRGRRREEREQVVEEDRAEEGEREREEGEEGEGEREEGEEGEREEGEAGKEEEVWAEEERDGINGGNGKRERRTLPAGGDIAKILSTEARENLKSLHRVDTLRISSSDVSALNTGTWRFLGLNGDPLASVEMVSMVVRLRRQIVSRDDTFTFTQGDAENPDEQTFSIPQKSSLAEALAEVEAIVRTTVDSTFCISPSDSGFEWRAFSRRPFQLSFHGSFAEVVGTSTFVAIQKQGRWVIPLQPADVSLARVLYCNCTELGGGNEGNICNMLIEHGFDSIKSFDGRDDIRSISEPISGNALTLQFLLTKVDGTLADQRELLSWSATIRVGFTKRVVNQNISALEAEARPKPTSTITQGIPRLANLGLRL